MAVLHHILYSAVTSRGPRGFVTFTDNRSGRWEKAKCRNLCDWVKSRTNGQVHFLTWLVHENQQVRINTIQSWLLWLSGLSTGLGTRGLPVPFPVRSQAWVTGLVPNERQPHIDVSLPLFLLPSPLS